MAKQDGIMKIEGTVENFTFYKKDGKSFVRKKGGVSKERIATDPSYVRTRENNSEFTHCMSSGKLLRTALGSMVFRAKDNKLSSRLMQVMSRIKKLDTTSTRGKRQVSLGLNGADGKQHLKGFDFNTNAPLQSVLFAPYVLDAATGVITIANLITEEQLLFANGSTHVSFQGAILALDFDTEVSELAFSPVVNMPINLTPSTVTLTPTSVPVGTGQQFFLLLISFFQEVNGVQYSLKNEEYNVLNILEVI